MKWKVRAPGIIAYSDKGYRIHISGFGVLTYTAIAPSHRHRPLNIGKFNDKDAAKDCCEGHFNEQN